MERILEWNKSLLIDETFLTQIKDIYATIGQKPIFTLITKCNAKYKFTSIEDFLKYDFNEDIEILIIENLNYSANNIFFKFEIKQHCILNYDCTSICKYTVEDNNFDSILKEKISKLYKTHVKSDWFIGKLSLLLFIMVISIIILGKFIIMSVSNHKMFSQPIDGLFVLGMFIGFFITISIRMIDKFICYKFFNPLVYYFGFQKNKWDRTLKLRENIFWVIIIGIVISLISTLIANNIFK